MPRCILNDRRAIDGLKEVLNREEPGWEQTPIWCLWHKVHHVLLSDERQLPIPRGPTPGEGGHTPGEGVSTSHRLPPIPAGKPANWCRWHETASPELAAPCAWCRTSLHVHQDALGRVKSGAVGKGYLVQPCPACHRPNAVYPVHGKRAIRTSKLEGDTPVMQLTMGM